MISTEDVVSVTEASRQLSTLVSEVEHTGQRILFRNNRPVAALIGVERLQQLQQAEDAVADIALLVARMITDSGGRTDLDEALAAFGVTRDELRDVDC
jgi:prevent-host-death family protein